MPIVQRDGFDGDLDFYVSNDGTETAMSQAGLSRCIKGESEWQPLRRLVNTLDINYQQSTRLAEVPAQLKHLLGKVFAPVAKYDFSRNKLIRGEACADIIEYFADQFTVELGRPVLMYPIAKDALKKFSRLGINGFIKEMAGYRDLSQQDDTNSLLKEVLEQLKIQSQQIQELQSQVKAVGRTEQQFPGVQIINNQVNNLVFLPSDLQQPFTIREWVLQVKGKKLSRNECMSLGRHVANSLTTLKLESPEKYGTGCIYRFEDIPGLMSAWEGWTKTRHR